MVHSKIAGHRSAFWIVGIVVAAAGLISHAPARGDDGLRSTTCGEQAYDIFIGGITGSIANYAAEQVPAASGVYYDAVSLPITTCNLGQQPLSWTVNSTTTPAFGMNLFRVSADRVEQIGQGWVHFGILPLQAAVCCTCTPVGGSMLGPGCSNSDAATIMGHQPTAGPKVDVNPLTGAFPAMPSSPPYSGTTARRLRARVTDLTGFAGSYLAEVQAIHPSEDPSAARNNVSYRRVTVSANGNERAFLLADSIVAGEPAIRAWAAMTPGVVETEVFLPEVGLAWVAARAVEVEAGRWHYEYAVQNVTIARAIQSISIPRGPGAAAGNFSFHDVDYADGDGINGVTRAGTDWPALSLNEAIVWATTPFATNPNANALRWGTLYNFGFDSTTPPCEGEITLTLFEPGSPATLAVSTIVPGCSVTPDGDYDNNGQVNLADYAHFADCMAGPQSPPAPVIQGSSAGACLAAFDFNTDGDVDSQDYATFAGL